jgi:hypothetical protein
MNQRKKDNGKMGQMVIYAATLIGVFLVGAASTETQAIKDCATKGYMTFYTGQQVQCSVPKSAKQE